MRQLLALALCAFSLLTATAQERHPLIIGGFPLSEFTNGELFALPGDGAIERIKIFPFDPNGDGGVAPFTKGSDGKVYGVGGGGGDGLGVIFRCQTDGTDYEVIYTFQRTNRSRAATGLIQLANGKFLGIQRSFAVGGTEPTRPFRINADGSGFEQLDPFPFITGQPIGLVDTPIGIFGITTYGSPQKGIIFSVGPTGSFSTVFEFPVGTANGSGINPYLLYASNGYLYGSASNAGANNKGTIFRVRTDGTDFGVIRHLSEVGEGGTRSNIIEIQGSIYTCSGLAISKYTMDGSVRTFVTSAGSSNTVLTKTPDDKILFYGNNSAHVTIPDIETTISLVDITGANLTEIKRFPVIADFPPIIDAGNGNYIGSMGSIFRIRLDGDLAIVKTFPNTDGSFPNGQLLAHPDGFFYGTTQMGGSTLDGVVYKVRQDGTDFTPIKALPGYITGPQATCYDPLLLGSNGFLYGTTADGGPEGNGIIYRLKTDGSEFEILHEFAEATDGRAPSGRLVEVDQLLYGTTSFGTGVTPGALYRINLDGSGFEMVYAITGNPDQAGVSELLPNVLYGSAVSGGANNRGYVYKFDLTGGGFTKVFDYAATAARVQSSKLIYKENTIYGMINSDLTTTNTFRMNPDGSGFTILASVVSNSLPRGQYILASDDYLYWQTWALGVSRVYRSKLNATEAELVYEFNADISRFIPFGLVEAGRSPQQITFSELEAKKVNDGSFALTATSSSTLPVSYTSSDPNIASIDGGTVTIHKGGQVEISASQKGNLLTEPAPLVKRTLVINKLTQTITFNPVTAKSVDSAPFTLAANSTSGLSTVFTTASDKITISGSTVATQKAGRAVVAAHQSGNDNYLPAEVVEQSFCVNPLKPTIIAPADINSSLPRTLRSTSDEGNQWFRNGIAIAGATNKIYTATEDGAYTVQVTVDDCKSAMSEPTPVVISGLYETVDLDISIYPNPARDEIVVKMDTGTASEVSIQLLDLLGRAIESRISSTGREEHFNLAKLEHGVFLFRIDVNNGHVIRTFVKQ